MKTSTRLVLALLVAAPLCAQSLEKLPDDPYFAPFKPLKAPPAKGLLLKPGDRLAICGDSITEQKMYSRIIETYLRVCVPELRVRVRQFGWSGERAPGFLHRMTNDVLRFKPTIATTCYGMNDHRYQPYTEEIGREYRESSLAIIRAFKAHGVRVIQGAAGAVGKVPPWAPDKNVPVTQLNLGLCELRNIDVRLAEQEDVAFADCFLPLLVHGFEAQRRWGDDYMLSGKDGVHPGWAGHLVMAYAFLKAMGLDGDLGTITVDLADGSATARHGHRILRAAGGTVEIESTRYPFCATGPVDRDSSIRSGMALVPFNEELNRLMLVVRHPKAARYTVTWGDHSRDYSAVELEKGVNLAADFAVNPFSEAFQRVDEAVAAKQAYETRQIKVLFHGPEMRADADMTVALTEKTRTPLAGAIRRAFQPVRHTLQITPR
ncbi:MAG: hypothetical protein D6766_12635 [Verrucomicrobia bacterium]|nr:MAG: hypothetical protein D6766_12635 [Verrucomicrobiota bacterium]